MPSRPQNEEELQKREAIGIIRASRFIRNFARSNKPINFDVICEIHKQIFKTARSDIAGKFRRENIKITGSKHRPPHYSRVVEEVKFAELDLAKKLKKIELAGGIMLDMKDPTDEVITSIQDTVEAAAWLHHIITYIHPFLEGNGRTARLAANLILERYGLVGISIKVEKENKNNYRHALAQIDQYKDYEPLVSLISEGLIDRYEGIPVKYYACK